MARAGGSVPSEEISTTITLIENFGVVPATSDATIQIGGKSVADSSGSSYFSGKITPKIIESTPVIPYSQAAYSPYAAQRKLLIPGWNPASVLVANSTALNSLTGYSKLGADPKTTVDIALKAWCLHFQDIGSDIYLPKTWVRVQKISNNSVVSEDIFITGGVTVKWKDALESLGNINISTGSSQQVIAKSKYPADYWIGQAIVDIDINSIGTSKSISNYNSFDIVMNWGFWSGISNDMGKMEAPFPIPPGSFILAIKEGSTNVNFRSEPSLSAKIIGKFNSGEALIENIPLDKSGWWGVVNPNTGSTGFIHSDYVKPMPIFYGPKPSQSVKNDVDISKTETNSNDTSVVQTGSTSAADNSLPKPDNTGSIKKKEKEKSNTLLYVGVGVGAIAAIGIAYAILKKRA